MFIKIYEYLRKSDQFNIPYKGKVLDNDDPKKLGRIKVEIKGLLEGETSSLPWIYPVIPYFLGGSEQSAIFSVPEVGSRVVVIFPYDSIYFGFYVGYWNTAKESNQLFSTNYPNTYGFIDSKGNYFKVDKVAGTIDVYHNSGTHVNIAADGTVNITIVANENANISGNVTVNVSGNVSVTASGECTIKAASIHLNP